MKFIENRLFAEKQIYIGFNESLAAETPKLFYIDTDETHSISFLCTALQLLNLSTVLRFP